MVLSKDLKISFPLTDVWESLTRKAPFDLVLTQILWSWIDMAML